jgi:hypothetical protein
MWRGVAARFSPEELRTHAHDLLGVGVSHRADVEDKLGATRRITVTVRAESIHTEHLRTRAGDSVVFGGQALEQEGRYRTRGVSGSVGFAVGGKGVLPGAGFLEAEVKVGAEAGRAVTTGVQTVDRDIRRVQARTGDPGHPGAPGPGDGEELVHRLQLRIEIHTDTELPEPVADRLGGRPGTRRRRPEATLTTADVDIETAPESAGAAPDRRASHVSARSVVPRHFLEPGPPPGDPGTEPAQPDVIHRVRIVGAHRAEPGPLELFLARRFQGVAFPGLAGVAEWAPTATLARQTAHGHVHRVRGPAPAVPAGFEPTGDRGLDLQLSLAQRNVRNKVDALFNGTLNLLPTTPGPALFLSARARVIRPAARPAGTPVRYFALGFPENATEHESNDKASRSLVREFTLSGGNSVAAGPNERRTALETITETAGGTGDYTERGRSHEQPSMEFELAVDVGIHGEDTALELSPLRKFTGLMPVRWAMEGHDLFPSRFAHPSSVTVQVDHQDLALSVQSASALAPDEGAIHLLADTHGPGLDADLASAARSVAVRTGRPVRLALVRHDGAGLETGLEYRLFDPDQAVHGAAEEAWAGYRLLAAAAEAESLAALDTARRLAAESAGQAVAAGQHFVDAAELRSSLPGTTTAAHAVDALWQATDSGFAIPAGHRDLALAQRAPVIRGTARLAVGGAIAADGGRTLRGLTLPRGELADAVAGRLIGLGPSLPAHVLVEGPDGAALAEAISRGHHTARHRTPPGTEAGGDSRIPPPITVIGTRAVAARGPGRIALTGWLAPLVNGFAPPRPGREGWAVYRDGVAVALSTRAARSRNATELIAALEPPESPGSPARRGRRPEGRTE